MTAAGLGATACETLGKHCQNLARVLLRVALPGPRARRKTEQKYGVIFVAGQAASPPLTIDSPCGNRTAFYLHRQVVKVLVN